MTPSAIAPNCVVKKLDANGRFVWQYDAIILERTPTFVRLEAYFNRDDIDLGYTIFAKGDRFIEYYYSDDWYNIFAVYHQKTDSLKGWYCNISRPARFEKAGAFEEIADSRETADFPESVVLFEDLALDLWVYPDGQYLVLDEDEFEELNLPPTDKQACKTAVAALITLAQQGQLPT